MWQCEPHRGRPDAALSVWREVDIHGRHHPKEALDPWNWTAMIWWNIVIAFWTFPPETQQREVFLTLQTSFHIHIHHKSKIMSRQGKPTPTNSDDFFVLFPNSVDHPLTHKVFKKSKSHPNLRVSLSNIIMITPAREPGQGWYTRCPGASPQEEDKWNIIIIELCVCI